MQNNLAIDGENRFNDEQFGNPEFDDARCYISRTARITGRVKIENDVIICPHVSLRADEGSPFYIGAGTNIQDSVIFHGLINKFFEVAGVKYSVYVGSECTIAHRALVHGPAVLGNNSFIGFNAIFHGSRAGEHTFIDFNATVKNATLGNYCHIGIGAIVSGVTITDHSYLTDGMVVTDQAVADGLPKTPEKIAEGDDHFNKEVVEFNKELRERYYLRRQAKEKRLQEQGISQ
ncbi:MAG: hypothetical protein WCK11_02295 [Candidatus Falkowbacteria bacterium]